MDTTCRGIGTIQRRCLNIREHWQFWSQRRWRLMRANRDDWKSTGHAAVQFLSRLNRRRCGCVSTRNGTDMRKVGRQCLWSRDRVTSKVFELLLLIFGVRNPRIAPSTTSSQFRKRCCGQQDYNSASLLVCPYLLLQRCDLLLHISIFICDSDDRNSCNGKCRWFVISIWCFGGWEFVLRVC